MWWYAPKTSRHWWFFFFCRVWCCNLVCGRVETAMAFTNVLHFFLYIYNESDNSRIIRIILLIIPDAQLISHVPSWNWCICFHVHDIHVLIFILFYSFFLILPLRCSVLGPQSWDSVFMLRFWEFCSPFEFLWNVKNFPILFLLSHFFCCFCIMCLLHLLLWDFLFCFYFYLFVFIKMF